MKSTTRAIDKAFPRRYLAKDFDPENQDALARVYHELESRSIACAEELENWILDWEELSSLIHDRYSRAYVGSTINTASIEAERRYLKIVEKILPLSERHGFVLSKKVLDSPFKSKLDPYFCCLLQAIEADARIFREENVELKVEERKLVADFERIMGSITVYFRDEELTLQQAARFLEDTHPKTRKQAFEALGQARLAHAKELNDLFDRLLVLRHKIATNAGFPSFREYQFLAYHRFDYGPKDCFGFHKAIQKHIVPLISEFYEERRKQFGTPTLRPWDVLVDPEAKQPLRPFETAEDLMQRCGDIFHKVDGDLGQFFEFMVARGLLDLESRKGKAPGGYCIDFSEARVPFIFLNVAGTRRDVESLLHEAGHAFHYFLARNQHLSSYHNTPLEFAEVASMSLELLSRPFLSRFYSGPTLKRVLDEQLRKAMEFFPFMAMMDEFQHWVYTHPNIPEGPSAAERGTHWCELMERFQPSVDWSGYEDIGALGWHYPHIFAVPFYYVEYGIAQLGALSVWRQSLVDYEAAIARYKAGLSLGGSKPLPELFEAVGARFSLSSEVIKPLVQAVKEVLAAHTKAT